MSGFLLPAALLVLLAVAFAVSALWQRSRQLAIAIAIVLPLAAAGLYAWRGTPEALDDAPLPVAAAPVATPEGTPPAPQTPAEVDKLVADLEATLEAEPNRWEGWELLGRVRMEQGRYPDAVNAFSMAHDIVPDNNAVAVGYAEALLRASPDKRFPPEAVAMLEHAARTDPPDQKGMFFLGMHRMLSGQPGEAADIWEALLPNLEKSAADALRPQIAAARTAAAQPGGAPAEADTGPALHVTVSLNAALATKATKGAVLYVFARAPEGGPPVAVERIVPGQWPVQVTLSDADRPMPTAKLSDHAQVVVTARLSLGGDAIAMAGDLESEPMVVAIDNAAPVELKLARVRP
ncbi:MAG: tetratricopeptide repeat protein [Arenimonas sp.]